MQDVYDIIIIGGGPAGLSAGLYGARSKAKTLILEKGKWGGQAATTEELENYPGSIEQPTGPEITSRMKRQAEEFGAETKAETVTSLDLGGKIKKVVTENGEYQAKTVLIATGAKPRLLGCPGELELRGKGVSYCATCDAAFFRGKPVAVVGGGNSALSEALYLAKFASEVYLIHRRDQFRATPITVEKARSEPRIKFVLNSTVSAVQGSATVEKLLLKNVTSGEYFELPVAGVFMAIGQKPNTAFLAGILRLDAGGYIITNEKMETGVPGILAAGDIRSNSIRQVISAAGDGATAAIYAAKYIEGQ